MDTQLFAMADIENAIRSYLQAHPRAIDTERGIREWWLRDSRPPCRAADVPTATERAYATSRPPTQVPVPRSPGRP